MSTVLEGERLVSDPRAGPDDTTRFISGRIPAELQEAIKVASARKRMPVQEILAEALTEWLERHT